MAHASTSQIQGWLERCRNGDPRVRDQLFAHTQDRLKALVRRHMRGGFTPLRDDMDSDDGMQKLFVRMLERWEQFVASSVPDGAADPVRAYFAFAAQVIRDTLCDALRKKYGRGKRPRPAVRSLDSPAGLGDSAAFDLDPADNTHGPEDLAVWADVHDFFDDLPDPLREVADLKWYHDLTHVEVAEILGITEDASRQRWTKIRRLFRDRFPSHPFM